MRVFMPAARRLDEAREDLARSMSSAIERRSRRLELASRDLSASSPEALLERGFSLVRLAGASGVAIHDASSIKIGDDLEIKFARGGALATTLEVRR